MTNYLMKVEECKDAGVHMFTFHWEAVGRSQVQALELAQKVRDAGMEV
jgi:pentose-5-phosphate-3-epimerase